MFFATPILKPEDGADRLLAAPVIKAAGVMLKIIASTETPIKPTVLRGGGVASGILTTELPYIIWEHRYKEIICFSCKAQNVMTTTLPLI